MLYLPRMFYTGGLAFSTAALVLVASVSTFNMIILSKVHDRVGAPSFSALGRVAFGRLYADGGSVAMQQAPFIRLQTHSPRAFTIAFHIVVDRLTWRHDEALGGYVVPVCGAVAGLASCWWRASSA